MKESVIDISLTQEVRKAENRQILSENQAEETEPKDAHVSAEKSSATEKESIHRGSAAATTQSQKQITERKEVHSKQSIPQNPSESTASKPLTFKLSPSTAESVLNNNERKLSDEQKSQSLQSKVLSSSGAFGSQDYLPSIADGDVTLMNAKASKFAVFVKRVALQVFSFVKTSGLTGVTAGEIREAENSVRYRAKLDKDGSLIRIEKENASGSGRFDEIVYAGIKRGAHDPNPPKDALASDGFYYFIFETRVWLRIEQDRGGIPRERRFILLSTGLE